MGLGTQLNDIATKANNDANKEHWEYVDSYIWPKMTKHMQVAAVSGQYSVEFKCDTSNWTNSSAIIAYIHDLCHQEDIYISYQYLMNLSTFTCTLDWSRTGMKRDWD